MTFPDFRSETREINYKESTISITGKCKATEPIVERESRSDDSPACEAGWTGLNDQSYAVPAPVPAPPLSILLRGNNMKIAGIDPKTLCNEVLLVLPRGRAEHRVPRQGLTDMDEFEAMCPLPKPPGKFTKDGWVPDQNDPTYQQVMAEWGKKRLGYIVTRSLEPSEIEWDTVKQDDPRTWAELGRQT